MSQELNFKKVDRLSYSYYMEGQWDSLITLVHKVEKQGIDYYYLNYRMGVAYYSKDNFFQSAYYFEKALEQNSRAYEDTSFSKMLYLSYIYTLRKKKAMGVPLSVKQRVKPLMRTALYLYGGGGSCVPLNLEDIQRSGSNEQNSGYKPEQAYLLYQQGQILGGLSVSHVFNRKLSADFSFTSFRFDDVTSFDNDDSLTINTFSIYQQSFAIIPEWNFGKRWSVRWTFGFMNNLGEPYILYNDKTVQTRTYLKYKLNGNSFLFGGNVYKQFRISRLGLELGMSNYTSQYQYQSGLNYLIYPWGNLNFYSYSSFSVKYENEEASIIFHQKIGIKTFSNLWAELSGKFGDIKNFNVFSEGYGYNITDHINTLLKGKLIFMISDNINLFVEGNFYKRYAFRNEIYADNSEDMSRVNYNYWTVVGGLSWNFNGGRK